MSEQSRPSGGGRRRAAPLTPEDEATRAQASEEARTGRRRAVKGRRRATPPEPVDPWTTNGALDEARAAPAAAVVAEVAAEDSTPTAADQEVPTSGGTAERTTADAASPDPAASPWTTEEPARRDPRQDPWLQEPSRSGSGPSGHRHRGVPASEEPSTGSVGEGSAPQYRGHRRAPDPVATPPEPSAPTGTGSVTAASGPTGTRPATTAQPESTSPGSTTSPRRDLPEPPRTPGTGHAHRPRHAAAPGPAAPNPAVPSPAVPNPAAPSPAVTVDHVEPEGLSAPAMSAAEEEPWSPVAPEAEDPWATNPDSEALWEGEDARDAAVALPVEPASHSPVPDAAPLSAAAPAPTTAPAPNPAPAPAPAATATATATATDEPPAGAPTVRPPLAVNSPVAAETTATEATPRSTFRTEIHGLRGLAVLLVVVYHLWLGRVSGGVDVFLFLSAFFLTGAFARRLEQGRPLGLRAYWARTFQRLYPPATIVILGALALAVTVLPVTSWPMIQRHAVASSLYLQNVALALDSVDYYQHDASSASPLQHFWSLSIQGQVFLVWPLLIGLLAVIGLRRRPRAVRPVLGVVFGMILAASLTWSVLETAHDQTRAYFDTSARLWEFAAGSLLALALPAIDRVLRARRPDAAQAPGLGALRALLGWAGIAGLIACGLVLDVRTAFPGWIALWPLGAAALVIVAGHSGTRWGVDRLLALRPVQGLGSISYALYLVHWPLLVGWLAWYGAGRAGLLDGFGLLAVSIAVAWVLTVLVDRPLHRSVWFAARRLRSVAVVVVCLVVLAGGSTLGFSAVTTRIIDGAGSGGSATAAPGTGSSTATRPASDLEHPGAAWTGSPLAAATAAPTPRADQSHAPEDLMPQDCGGRFGTPEEVTCRIAPATGTPTATVLIAGDSHSAQYASAVMEAASSPGWTVYYVGKPGCSFSTGSGKPECAVVDTIWPRVLDELRPDVVLTLGSHSAADGTPEVARADLPAALALVQDRGIPALVLRDNPRWAVDEYACAFDAVRSGGDARAADAACGAPLTDKLAATDPTLSFADPDPVRRVVVADPSTEVLCPGGRCSPIIGNVYVYRDDDHLTADFSATMGPWIGAQLDQVLAPAGPSDG